MSDRLRKKTRIAIAAGPAGRTQRRRRRWPRILGIACLLIAVIIWFLPRLAGTRLGISLIESAISSAPDRIVSIKSLDLRWSGTQRIQGLSIVDGSQGELANVDLTLNGSLLSWLRGSHQFGTVLIQGSITLPIDADAEDAPAEPIILPDDLDVVLQWAGLNIVVSHTGNGVAPIADLRIEDAHGSIKMQPGLPISFDAAGQMRGTGRQGEFSISGVVDNLIDAQGIVALTGAAIDVQFSADGISTALLDALVGQDGDLVRLLGDSLSLDGQWRGSLQQGSGRIAFGAPNVETILELKTVDGRLQIAKPAEIALTVDPETWRALAGADAADRLILRAPVSLLITLTQLDVALPVDGLLDLTNAAITLDVRVDQGIFDSGVEHVPALAVTGLVASLSSTDVTDSVSVRLDARIESMSSMPGQDRRGGAIGMSQLSGEGARDRAGGWASRLTADVVLRQPITRSGLLNTAGLGVAGTVEAHDLPMSVIDSLSGADGWLADLVGAKLDSLQVYAHVEPGGATDRASMRTRISLRAGSEGFTLRGGATLADGKVTSDDTTGPIILEATLSLQALQRVNRRLADHDQWAGIRIEEAGRVRFTIERLELTLPGAVGESLVESLSFSATADAGPVVLSIPNRVPERSAAEQATRAGSSGRQRLALRQFSVELFSLGLRDSVEVRIAGELISVPGNVAGPTVLEGAFAVVRPLDPGALHVDGSLYLRGLPISLVEPWVGGVRDVLAEAVGADPLDVQIAGTYAPGRTNVRADLNGKRSRITAEYTGEGMGSARISADGTQVVTPRLAELLLARASADDAPYFTLVEPAEIAFSLKPTVVAAIATDSSIDWSRDWRRSALDLSLKSDSVTLNGLPGVSETLTGSDLQVHAVFAGGIDGPVQLQGGAEIDRSTDGARIAQLAFKVGIEPSDGGAYRPWGNVELAGIDVAALEKVLGAEPGNLTGWLGARGEISIETQPSYGDAGNNQHMIVSSFDRLSCRLVTRIEPDRLLITGPSDVRMTLDRALLDRSIERLMATAPPASSDQTVGQASGGGDGRTRAARTPTPPTPSGPARSPAPQNLIRFDRDVSLEARIRRMSVPMTLLRGESFATRLVSLDVVLSADRISLTQGSQRIEITDAALNLGGPDLRHGLTFDLQARQTSSDAGGAEVEGSISIVGTCRALSSDPEAWRIDAQAEVQELPVALIDGLAHLNGKLVSSLGPTANVGITLRDAGLTGGEVVVAAASNNGWMILDEGRIEDGVLYSDAPFQASLDVTAMMARTVLSNVNPMFYDVQKKSGPIVVEAHGLAIPLDGDLSRLNVQELILDLGQVEVPSGGLLADLLGTKKNEQPELTEARIPPISAKITNGILQYDKLVLQTPSFTITTQGSVDLVKRELNLLAEVPLIGWKSVFGNIVDIKLPLLGDVEADVPFYLIVHGPIDDPVIEPDPKGAQRVADEFFGNLVENLFRNLFEPKRPRRRK